MTGLGQGIMATTATGRPRPAAGLALGDDGS
jgi:hypothetical protein